jgi:hypothetical protein
VVPVNCVKDFTFGRANEIAKLTRQFECLAQEGSGALLLEGGYGDGKTHLLDYAAEAALDRGCVVMRADLDPFEVPLSNPKRVYNALATSLRYRSDDGKDAGLKEFIAEAAGTVGEIGHDYIDAAMKGARKLLPGSDEIELVWDWFRGEQVSRWYISSYGGPTIDLPPMLPHMTSADMYCYILSGFGYLAKKLGRPGVVLIVDEAECAMRLWYIYYRERAIDFLRGLFRVALSDEALLDPWEDRLRHSGLRRMPYLFRKPSGLLLLIALTPSHEVDVLLESALPEDDSLETVQLNDVDDEVKDQILTAVVEIYGRAYPRFRWPTGMSLDPLEQLIGNAHGLRFAVRSFVAAMDLVRHYPDRDPEELLQLA